MLQIGNISVGWRDMVDVALVTLLFYRIILMVKGTRAVASIYGLLLVLVVYFVAEEVGLYTLHWLLGNFLGSIFLVIIILFNRDIRRALTEMGARGFWRKQVVEDDLLNEVVGAVLSLAQRRVGALIVLERNVPLGDTVERGVPLDAKVTKELLISVFQTSTPLHDGAVVLRGGRLSAAGCILPLAVAPQDRPEYGTRHRAAMGITEETDAVAIVVSEERGAVTVSIAGRLTTALDATRLKRVLRNALER
ncbi:diadenylate cyclase CdaA [Desulfovibrio psychrotolerans]|uniref:Diadenylate cyclase n=1 Tax=Desulfovibrio psychrotolerans TaxID=415242 RepID=A0A7J0BRW3_9BACT|nr:diadenylate cyclase CdaA [Desulfovibrio psychrotolerans]GFM35895.1 membrane protein [Desulfovibrio psychrotolerans]